MSQTTETTPVRPAGSAGAYRLLVVHSPGRKSTGVTVALSQAGATIRRATGAPRALELDDAEVSRAHAALEPEESGEGYRIRDLGSRNGTYKNGARVENAALASGDVIRVGSHLLLFEYLSIEAVQRLPLSRPNDPVLVGDSIAMCELRERVRTVARAAVPILILGETGVGKELVAQELHKASGRRGPFVAVNCAALPAELVESELFGHVKGAFTGATGESKGLFGEADGGTLFLDEIGEMPIALQPKLLRALSTGEVRAVGAATARTVDVRVVAATNVLLDQAVEEKRFRGDLHARLLGSVVPVPPLRERRADIPSLIDHFLAAEGCAVEATPDAAEALLVHRWPYNVRELEQIVRAAAPDAREAGSLGLEQLPVTLRAQISARAGAKATAPPPAELPLLLRVRRDGTPNAEELREVLAHFGGNVAQVAAYFGRDRRQVYRWAERLGVELAAFREDDDSAGD